MAQNSSEIKVLVGVNDEDGESLRDLAAAMNAAPGQKVGWNIVIFLDPGQWVEFPGFTVVKIHDWPVGLDVATSRVTNNGVAWYDQNRPCVFQLKAGDNTIDPVIIPR
jgi:hypothetical protein